MSPVLYQKAELIDPRERKRKRAEVSYGRINNGKFWGQIYEADHPLLRKMH
jgi:hypothetical protein